jgi:hypothetical protein
MVPGGLLYLEVNVHHAVYHSVSLIHTGWRALGVPYEITPFADHTVHLTINAARGLFSGLPLRILKESDNISEVKRTSRQITIRHAGDWVKRLFFKNARYKVIAMKEPLGRPRLVIGPAAATESYRDGGVAVPP